MSGIKEAENPFPMEAKQLPSTEAYVKYKTEEGVQGADKAADKASNNTYSHTNEQYNTDPSNLMHDEGSNIAKDGGRFGRINNKDYNTTLHLAREADRYNNMPMEHMFSQRASARGGMTDRGTGIEKPVIKTMETRASDQSYDLDTNQKKLLQSLQDAVNRKNYDAFKACYKQLYGIDLSNYETEVKMREFKQQQEIAQLLAKDKYSFQTMMDNWLLGNNATAIYKLAGIDPTFASMLGQPYNMTPPDRYQITDTNYANELLEKKLGPNWRSTASGTDIQSVLNQAARELHENSQRSAMDMETAQKDTTSIFGRILPQWGKDTKKIYKENDAVRKEHLDKGY